MKSEIEKTKIKCSECGNITPAEDMYSDSSTCGDCFAKFIESSLRSAMKFVKK